MKKFILNVITSFIGTFVAGFFLLFVGIAMFVASIASGLSGEQKIQKSTTEQSVLQLNLSGEIHERANQNIFSILATDGNAESIQGLNQILQAIKGAETDDNIEGIYIKAGALQAGYASVNAIREAIKDFKKSGKFVYSYGEVYTEKTYFISTVADKIYMFPSGYLEWNGLASVPMYLRGTLDKLGIKPMVFKVGKYKSAAESLTEKKMSLASREQNQLIVDGIWNYILEGVATERKGLTVAELNEIAGSLKVSSGKEALKYKMVDQLKYENEVIDILKEKVGLDTDAKIALVSPAKYAKTASTSANKIAIIYANGQINSSGDNEAAISSEAMCKTLRKVRKDDDIKAVVLRVNSPGGSALASDVIANEIKLLKEKKPVIASYGDVAASGGYFISARCDKIVADPLCITGSIGVIGMMANMQGFLEAKLGVTFDRLTSAGTPSADLGNPMRTMTTQESSRIQRSVDDIYDDFISVVLEGRKSKFEDKEAVHNIAQGRVWLAGMAQDTGLVDVLGGINKAIELAAKAAEIEEDYAIAEYPKLKTLQDHLRLALESSSTQLTVNPLKLNPEFRQFMKTAEALNSTDGMYMHLMTDLNIK